MKRRVLMTLAVSALVAAPAAGTASASEAFKGPCERQQELFETANIQMDMNPPLAGTVYNTACGVTG